MSITDPNDESDGPDEWLCTYCNTTLASEADDVSPGDELQCADCGITYDIVAESERHDLAVFVCPYCGEENKRSQGVERVVCENNNRVGGDCGLTFDPAGAETLAVSESDQSERPKMVPRDVGGSEGGDE